MSDISGQTSPFTIEQLAKQILPNSNLKAAANSFDPISSIFSVLFAREEAKRFTGLAFERWLNHSQNKVKFSNSIWQMSGEDNEPLSSWLEFNFVSAPLWSALRTPGPWHNDPRTPLIMQALSLIDQCLSYSWDFCSPDTASWHNLRLGFSELISANRQNLPGNFLPDMLLIVEGPTEVILLPYFAACLGINIGRNAVMFVAAGGANQVLKKYMYFKELVRLPIFCLLDSDAIGQYSQILANLRAEDHVWLLENGEIEDMFALKQLVPLLNSYLATLQIKSGVSLPIEASDFPENTSYKRILERLWRERELGKFDKVNFAKFVAGQETSAQIIAAARKPLIETLLNGHFS